MSKQTGSDGAMQATEMMQSLEQAKEMDEKAVQNFREYLQIPSVHPDINYDKCVEFLIKQAESLNLSVKIHHIHPKIPIVILTWEGTQPSEQSILLNSHMDVVPAYENRWTYPPFSAHMDDWGNIYGRGSQDTKCVGIQYLEAIRRLKMDGKQCKRTIHISFVPDKEIDSFFGLKIFVNTSDFDRLNVGFALDVGMASMKENFLLFNGEKSTWHVHIICASDPVNGSIMPDNTAGEKLTKIIDRLMEIDKTEKQKYLKLVPLRMKSDEVTSVTLTKVWGGVDANDVLNIELNAMFEISLGSTADHKAFENIIKKACKKVGQKVETNYFFEQKDGQNKTTVLERSNIFWRAFSVTCIDIGVKLDIEMRPTSSDSRFLRERNIPVVGFSPINNTKMRHNDDDEYINKQMFLQGIGIYYKIIWSIGNAFQI